MQYCFADNMVDRKLDVIVIVIGEISEEIGFLRSSWEEIDVDCS